MSKGAWSSSSPAYAEPIVTKFINTAIGSLPAAPSSINSSSTIAQTLAYILAGTNVNADFLDGQHGSFYLNASNMASGTLPDERFPGRIGAVCKYTTNINAEYLTGFYWCNSTAIGVPSSAGKWLVHIMQSGDASGPYGMQIAYMYTGSSNIVAYARLMTGGGQLGSWVRLYLSQADQATLWATAGHTHSIPAVIEMACGPTAAAGASPIVIANRVAVTRCRKAQTITLVRASLDIASTSGIVTFRIKKNGTSIFTTNLTIDAGELTSKTAATAYVLSSTSIAEDDEISVDIVTSGTAARGPVVAIIGNYS